MEPYVKTDWRDYAEKILEQKKEGARQVYTQTQRLLVEQFRLLLLHFLFPMRGQ
jgi:hypothetical protein